MKNQKDKLDCPQCGVFMEKNGWPGTTEYACPICKGTWTPTTSLFAIHRFRAESISAVVRREYEQVKTGTDKAALTKEAKELDREHPAWFHFVGVPRSGGS